MKDKRIEKIILNSTNYANLSPSFSLDKIGASYIFACNDSQLNYGLLEELLKKFYCTKIKEGKPCGECAECVKVQNKTHIDITYFGQEGESVKKDEIRELLEDAVVKPFEAEHKFLVITSGEKLSEMVQNLLLKTLEDLPSFVTVIILTKSLVKILPTIRSRCQVVQLIPLEKKDVIMLLGSSEKALHLADVADGSLDFALKYANKIEEFDRDYKFALTLVTRFSNSGESVEKANYLINKKDKINECIKIIQAVLYLALKDKVQANTSKKVVAKNIKLCDECLDMLDKNVLKNMVIDHLLIQMLKNKKGDN